ncbi:MAG: sugar transferase [Anaerolineaceae bacterium]|nr:sugar transferase [Anaerolineaceae bacterium]
MNLSHHKETDWVEKYSPQKRVLSEKNYLRIKRILDIAVILLSSPIWFPVIILIGIAIKLSSPKDAVFFIQQRTGKDGKRFAMIKFRTMVANSEEEKHTLDHLNVLKWPDFKIPNDPRITRIGRFLRKTSLDELPQVINILKGEMSLVGPRPTSFSPETYALWHTERLEVVPGLTGLWQISERGVSDFDERLRLDITYIEHHCLRLDFEILLRTIAAVFKGRGAF